MSTINNVSINNVLSLFTSGYRYDIIEDDSNGKNLISITDKTYLVSFENIKGRYRFGLVKLDLLEGSRGQSINLVYTKDAKLHLSSKSTGANIYFKPSYKNPDILASVKAYNKDNPSNQIDAIYCCDASIIFVEKEEEMNNMEQSKKVAVTKKPVLYKTTMEDKIEMIKRHKEKIVSIFNKSRITEKFMNTLIDNIDEFVEFVKDNETFTYCMDSINTMNCFIGSCVVAGKSNEEIKQLIDSIDSKFKNIKHYDTRRKHKADKEESEAIFNGIIDAKRNSSNIDDYFESVLDILNNSSLKDVVTEELDNLFNTSLSYIIESYIEELCLDKRFVFAILLAALDDNSIEKAENDILNKKIKISKLKDAGESVEREKDELRCMENSLEEEINDRNRNMAKLYRYTQEIIKLNLQ